MSLYNNFIKTISLPVKLYHRLEVYGKENLPPKGEGFILTPNHSGWFGWDGLVINSILKDREINWVAWSYGGIWDEIVKAFKGILYNNQKNFPYEKICEDILMKGNIVGIFPEGNSNPVGKWYRLRSFFPGCIRL